MRNSCRRLLWLGAVLLAACDAPHPSGIPGGALRLGAVLGVNGASDLRGFARAETPREFRFPEDHGPHPDFRSEWWYLTVAAEDEAGRPVGVQFTLFRQALAPAATGEAPANRWQSTQVYLAHFAVTDSGTRTHREEERFARGHPRLAGATASPFRLWLEDWELAAVDESRWRLEVRGEARSAVLDLAIDTPPVLRGNAGLSRKGPTQASYYYALPDIEVTGRVSVDGVARAIRGNGWLDREWSTSVLSADQSGWDWFALSLTDGRRIMLYQLRHPDGSRDPYDQGMITAPHARPQPLTAADFDLVPVRHWRDDAGVAWPVAWTVRLGSEVWSVEAVLDDQRMDTSIRYWEGLVRVRDRAGAEIGRGYLELTGYDAPGATDNGESER